MDAGYSGTSWSVTTTHLPGCSDGGSFSFYDLGLQNSPWNNTISSFRSNTGCLTTLWDNANFSGISIGPYGSLSSLGTMNDRANSVRWPP